MGTNQEMQTLPTPWRAATVLANNGHLQAYITQPWAWRTLASRGVIPQGNRSTWVLSAGREQEPDLQISHQSLPSLESLLRLKQGLSRGCPHLVSSFFLLAFSAYRPACLGLVYSRYLLPFDSSIKEVPNRVGQSFCCSTS